MSIGSILRERRNELGLLQGDVAERLREKGFNVTNHAVNKWEVDKASPNADQFLALCQILNITDVMDEFLDIHSSIFYGLNRAGRDRLKEYARLLRNSDEFRLHNPATQPVRMLPLYELAVSAGTGQFLDGENYEMVECGIEVPEGSNFGVRIAGNSMEPKYHDGQTIWVRQQRDLMSGEIGIFLYDGDAYLKKLVAEDGEVRLHSLNPEYKDIIVSPGLPLRVLGKVLS